MNNPRFSTDRFARQEPSAEFLIPKREGSEVTSFEGLQNAIHTAILALRSGPGMDPQNADAYQHELEELIKNPKATVVDYTRLQSRIQASGSWDSGSEKM